MCRQKRKMAHRAVIAKWWRDHPEEWPELNDKVDWDEPSCWACGWLAAVAGKPNHTFAKAWQNSYLIRCHLVDHWLGGAGSPENLVLLCQACHVVMPSFSDRREALTWVRETDTELAFRRAFVGVFLKKFPDVYEKIVGAA